MNRFGVTALALVTGVVVTEFDLTRAQPLPPVAAVTTNIPYLDAKPIFEELRQDLLPWELRTMTSVEREMTWHGWVSRHDAAIRARLQRGDEDSVINFLLYGTAFTNLARTTPRDLGETPDLIVRRTEDLIAGMQSPGTNERLQFAREVVERNGMNPTTAKGQREIRRYFADGFARISREMAVLAGNSEVELVDRLTHFRDRGLSSDTSIFPSFAIEQALEVIKADGLFDAGAVRRVAIVGPGLDFTDKHEGYDFYPPQTIQPFAVIDSLIRLGLVTADRLQVTTFDLSSRVNHHLETARQRARTGGAYSLQLPRDLDKPWTQGLVKYWERIGDKIGEETKAAAVPSIAGSVEVRAIRVRPSVVLQLIPHDLNIVLQRLEPLAAEERFDLIIATNVLAYYDVFEQSLALVNLAKMLRRGGVLLTNNGTFELPAIPLTFAGDTHVTYMHLPGAMDRLLWHRRQ